MAETTTLKKIFDVLFEPDPNNSDDEKQVPKAKEQTRYKAEDFLYEKKNKLSEETKETKFDNIFVDYNIKKETKNEYVADKEEVSERYEPSMNISPIFGVIEDKKKKDIHINADVDYASVNKPTDSHLGTVLSPFYGYSSPKNVEKKEDNEIKKEEIEDFDITEDLGDIFATDEFKQEIKEEGQTEEIDLFSDFDITEDK